MKAKRITALLLVVAMLFTFVSVIAACSKHECKHVCEVCGKCTDATCEDPACAEKCPGHETAHECGHKCPTCGKCTDATCTDPACADKCPGHEAAPAHTCKHVCPTCGKCTDATCTDPVCADKCQGHQTVDPDKGKTKDDPLTPDEAIALMDQAGDSKVVGAADKQQYYIQGVVNAGSTINSYSEWSFTLGTGSKVVSCQATIDNAVTDKPADRNGALDGKTVIIKGFLELYYSKYQCAYLPASASPTGAKFTPSIVDITTPVAAPESITLDYTGELILLPLSANRSFALHATVLPANAPQDVVWSISENNASITVNANGVVNWELTEGEATVTATVKDTSLSASVDVKVKNVHGSTEADPLTVDEAIALMTEVDKEVFPGYLLSSKVGFYLTGKVANSVFNRQNTNSYWTFDLVGTEGELACTCTSFTGVANANGNLDDYTVVIRNAFLKRTASEYTVGSTNNFAYSVSATRPELTGIQIEESATVDMGGSTLLTATPVPANALLGDNIEWHTSAEQTATVANGVVVGVAAGTAEITASVGEVTSNKCTVTVSAVEITKAVYDWTEPYVGQEISTDNLFDATGDLVNDYVNVWTPGQIEIKTLTVTGFTVTYPDSVPWYPGIGYDGYFASAPGNMVITTEHAIKKITLKIVATQYANAIQLTVNGTEFKQEKGSNTWNGQLGSASEYNPEFDLSAAPTNTITITAPQGQDLSYVIVGMTLEW